MSIELHPCSSSSRGRRTGGSTSGTRRTGRRCACCTATTRAPCSASSSTPSTCWWPPPARTWRSGSPASRRTPKVEEQQLDFKFRLGLFGSATHISAFGGILWIKALQRSPVRFLLIRGWDMGGKKKTNLNYEALLWMKQIKGQIWGPVVLAGRVTIAVEIFSQKFKREQKVFRWPRASPANDKLRLVAVVVERWS